MTETNIFHFNINLWSEWMTEKKKTKHTRAQTKCEAWKARRNIYFNSSKKNYLYRSRCVDHVLSILHVYESLLSICCRWNIWKLNMNSRYHLPRKMDKKRVAKCSGESFVFLFFFLEQRFKRCFFVWIFWFWIDLNISLGPFDTLNSNPVSHFDVYDCGVGNRH